MPRRTRCGNRILETSSASPNYSRTGYARSGRTNCSSRTRAYPPLRGSSKTRVGDVPSSPNRRCLNINHVGISAGSSRFSGRHTAKTIAEISPITTTPSRRITGRNQRPTRISSRRWQPRLSSWATQLRRRRARRRPSRRHTTRRRRRRHRGRLEHTPLTILSGTSARSRRVNTSSTMPSCYLLSPLRESCLPIRSCLSSRSRICIRCRSLTKHLVRHG